MPSAVVAMRASILMKPRSVSCTPASLRPMFSVLGARPAATSTFSTVSVLLSPLPSMVSVTESLPTLAEPILAPVTTSILRFLKLRTSSADTSASSSGSSVGSTSISVTCVPKAENTSANSQPTAPAPMTAIVLGARSSTSTSSDERTVVLLMSRPACGSPRTREPVEMTMAFLASCVSSFPSAFLTATLFLPAMRPVPLIHVILCFLNRNSTPFEFCWLTARERFIATP